jgi:hypothetical protein
MFEPVCWVEVIIIMCWLLLGDLILLLIRFLNLDITSDDSGKEKSIVVVAIIMGPYIQIVSVILFDR